MIQSIAIIAQRSRQRIGLRVASLGWSMASQLCGLVIRLGGTLVLARLLAPEAFGLLGTAMALLTTLEWLSDCGITPAIIRHPRGDEEDVLSTGWWLTLSRGILLSCVAVAAAWPLAGFYDQSQLAPVLAVLGLRPVMMALRSPGMPRLRRSLNYRAIFVDETAITLLGTAASVTAALIIPSVWALVVGTIVGAMAGVAASYLLCPILPKALDRRVAGEIAKFGTQVFINTLIMAVWMNLDRLLGLKLISPVEMGLYTIAWNLSAVADGLCNRACDVHFSVLSGLSAGRVREHHHRTVMRRCCLLSVPALILSVLISPIAIEVLYDDRYAAAGPLLAILAARGVVRGVGQAEFQLLLADGQIRYGTIAYATAAVIQASLLIPLVSAWGVAGLATATLISTIGFTTTQAVIVSVRGRHAFLPHAAAAASLS